MKNKILSIVLALLLVISLAGNVVLFNNLSKEKVNSNDYQEAMSQLVILKTDLDNANDTIADLEEKVENFNATIGTSTAVPEEEITAEMLEGLSAELTEEQQEAATAEGTPADQDTANKNNNNGNNGNNNSSQQQPNPDLDAWMKEMIENGATTTLPPITEPEHEFGYDDGIHGAIAQ